MLNRLFVVNDRDVSLSELSEHVRRFRHFILGCRCGIGAIEGICGVRAPDMAAAGVVALRRADVISSVAAL